MENKLTKAVVLASGRGLRMGSLTAKTPKPLLPVNGKPIIDYIFDALPVSIDEVIIAVKYLGDQIKDYLGNGNAKRKIRYVQGSYKGNAYSFMATKKYLRNERFLLVYGDEIPNPANVRKCLKEDLSILTFNGGEYDGVMVLNTDIFNYKPKDEMFRSLVGQFVKDHKVSLIEAKDFVGGINTPADLVRVERELNG